MRKAGSAAVDLLLPALPGLAFALGWIALALVAFPGALQGQLGDPDSHMVIVRLREFLATGSLQHGFLDRDNAPYGMVLHWTMIYDLLLLAVAAPFAAILGWSAAITMLAPFVGPFCVLLLVLVATWAAAPILSGAQRGYFGLFVALAPMVLNYGKPGNATHHLAVVIAWAVFMGFALRVATRNDTRANGMAAGAAATLALWINVECVPGVAAGAGLMMLAWIRDGARRRAGNLAFALGFALTALAAHLVDRPYGGYLAPEIDRFSIVYVTFAWLLLLTWLEVASVPQTAAARPVRFVVAAGGAAFAALVLLLLFPQLLSPRQDVFSQLVYDLIWSRVGEMLPAYASLRLAVTAMTTTAVAALAALFFVWRAQSTEARQAWLAYLLVLAAVTAPAIPFVRFAIYPQVVAGIAGVLLIEAGAARIAAPIGSALVRVLGAAVWIALPVLILVMLPPQGSVVPIEDARACALPPVAAALDDPARMGAEPAIVLTHPNTAPETLYWTRHRVVAGPYHRNFAGLSDAATVMAARDDAVARDVIARRGVGYVLVCASGVASGVEHFFDRLRAGDAPVWLEPVPWPAGVDSKLRLYRVR